MTDPLKLIDATSTQQDAPEVAFWRKEISLAHKREEKFQKEAKRITEMYEGDKKQENSFNILFSNTQTLLPAVYNQLPRPFVDRRYKDEDPLGKVAAKTLERVLSAIEDSGDAEYDSFDTLLEQAVLGALVPGRGLTKFRYEAKISGSAEKPVDDEADARADSNQTSTNLDKGETTEAGPGEKLITVPSDSERVEYETICGDDIDYNHVVFGYARRWHRVPWVGHIHFMEKEDAIASFGKALADKLVYTDQPHPESWKQTKPDTEESTAKEYQKGSRPTAVVYEIWHKEKKEVVFFAPSVPKQLLKEIDDPYGLSGFYPFPEPLTFTPKRSTITPTPLFIYYEEQAKELNRLTQRINRLLHALKVRGFYDGSLRGLKELLNAEDNTLIPAPNVAALRDGQSIENSIWMVPIKDIVYVLQQLVPAREVCKNTIYEITGIADIMRGDTQASETATAQNIKNAYGTLKLNKYRKKVQNYARDCLRIIGELAAEHFSIDTFAAITNLDYAKPDDVKRAQQTIQMLNQQYMQMVSQFQAQQMQAGPAIPPPVGSAGAPGAPPPQTQQPSAPPPPPPQMQQQMQQAQAILQKPRWEDICNLLRNDLVRNYRIDIETNSTIASDTQEDKENIQEALGAITTMFEKLAPVVQQGAIPMPAVKSMVMSVVRRFQFGREVEDAISQMPDQLPPPPPDPGAPTQDEIAAKKAQAQLDQQTAIMKMQTNQMEQQRSEQEHQFKMAAAVREEQMAGQKHQQDMAESQSKIQQAQVELETAIKMAEIKLREAEVDLQIKAHDRDLKEQDAAIRRAEANTKTHESNIRKADSEIKQGEVAVSRATTQQQLADIKAGQNKPKPNGEDKAAKGPKRFEIVRAADGKMKEVLVH